MPSYLAYSTFLVITNRDCYGLLAITHLITKISSPIKTFSISGIIAQQNIGGVISDGNFSAQSITENTEVIWMEEWMERSLRADDEKRLLQGRQFYKLTFYVCFQMTIQFHTLITRTSTR